MSRPAARPRADHAQVAAACRAHPGQWQQVSVHRSSAPAQTAAQSIRTAYRRRWYAPAGSFDAEVVVHGDVYAVRARYIGQPHT